MTLIPRRFSVPSSCCLLTILSIWQAASGQGEAFSRFKAITIHKKTVKAKHPVKAEILSRAKVEKARANTILPSASAIIARADFHLPELPFPLRPMAPPSATNALPVPFYLNFLSRPLPLP